jgi:hypothetical protein
MKLFICWSGERSRGIAGFLHNWLPAVHQNIEPFISDDDIGSGIRWRDSLTGQLGTTEFGIVCLTSENLTASWLHFEAGALSKLPKARVVPILYQLTTGDIQGPLGDFQAATFGNKDGMRRVLASINDAMGDRANKNWERTFDVDGSW